MNFELNAERQAFAEVLVPEVKKVMRMLRAFPLERFERRDAGCGRSGRDLASEIVSHLVGIEEIAYGRVAPRPAADSHSHGALHLELETAAMGAYTALMTLPAARWGEVLEVPPGLAPWHQARRGELLWRSLRAMVRHDRHFAFHLRGERHDGEGRGHRWTPRSRSGPVALQA